LVGLGVLRRCAGLEGLCVTSRFYMGVAMFPARCAFSFFFTSELVMLLLSFEFFFWLLHAGCWSGMSMQEH
jgi:hypothetical protein